ncbi:MAG: 5'-nucleotidase, lipoprotein e(P4) family [Salinivirgaceae bacterium]|nr:5'-nucleotidase, lipoprotein e(P4) family [Salinivirgaceae bacterium]
MKKLLLLYSIVSILIGCQTNKTELNPNEKLSNSEHLVMATAWFQKSAEMRACFYQAYNLAELRLQQHLENHKGEKPAAVVLDIDETILDNSPFEKKLIDDGILYTSELWKKWTDKKAAKALPGAIEFTQKASEMGVQVIYISNRKVDMLESTINNMKKLGFPNADPHFVYLREMNKSGNKTERREKVMAKYEVLLFIGDNLTDLNELFAQRDSTLGFKLVDDYRKGFGDKFIVLPNPMYGEWEEAIYKNDYSISFEKKRALRKEILDDF